MVPKSDGGWRPCGDFRRLNNATTNDRYPIPHIQDFSVHLAGAVIFSKVDLVRGYHQVPVRRQDVPKTAVITPFGLFETFITPFGLFEFLRMPFGLKGAAQTFQRLMDSVLRDMPFLFVYLDDVLVASASVEEHMSHLRQLFERLSQHGLIVNPAKCRFGLLEIEFLGHRVSRQGAVPLPAKVEAVLAFPRPSSVKPLQEFLGMVNFYNRFIPRAAHIMHSLYDALKGRKGNQDIEWTQERSLAFEEAKTALAEAALLAHPKPSAPIALTTDASDYAVGAVCEQWSDGHWQPLAFFSRKLRDSERKYSTFDRELLALFLATRHFRFLLEGREFTAFVDHKPLTFAMAKTSEPWSSRQQRHLSAISELTTDIQHVAGKNNLVADCLSRAPVATVHLGIDYTEMAADQLTDLGVQGLRTADSSLKLEDVDFQNSGAALLCDISMDRPRPVVPATWRRRIFDAVHSLSHPGVKASVKLVGARFVWPGLRKDVKTWASTCVACQRAKVQRHVKAPLGPFPVPERRFEHVHVDLVGPFPPSRGFTHLLTMVDRTTRWPEAVPLSSTTAPEVARAFLYSWVSRFGVPLDMTSDRGPQFTSELWNAVAGSLGVKLHWTTAYHPQANGLCKRFHRTMKAALRASLVDGSWVDRLPWVLLGLRSAPKEDLRSSSAQLVLGQSLRVPGEFLHSGLGPGVVRNFGVQGEARFFSPVAAHHCLPRSFIPKDLMAAKYVFIRHDAHRSPLQAPYDGPFRVLEAGHKSFLIEMGTGQDRVSVDRLKPAHVLQEDGVELARPARRGRPPNPAPDIDPLPLASPPQVVVKRSRRGRVVRVPTRFQ
uniref:Gypsy retrotransposon integrase-like protein 1 n=1 Tax=Knipowitschia caucasica TaxID=637954 RepID=A0AAV2LTK4_KNICA